MSHATTHGLRIVINACSVTGAATGIGNYTRNLVSALSQTAGQQQYIALRSHRGEGSESQGGQLREHVVDTRAPLWEQLQLPNLLHDLKAQVYHNPAFGLPVVRTVPQVCTVHDCIPRLFPEYAPPWLRHFFEHWAPVWLRGADHIICASAHTRHDVEHLYGITPSRLSVVHQAADGAYQPVRDPARLEALMVRYGIDAPYVLYVGRIELRKNVAGLLAAFREVRKRVARPLMLVMAGPSEPGTYDPEGVLPPEGRSGDVLVTGYVPTSDLVSLYSGCAVFCLPSFYEGFGIPVLEAMQCGAPVVTSRVSSLPEVGGNACLYVDPYDSVSIADGLECVLGDDVARECMREAGLERSREFSLDRFALQTAAVYQRVANECQQDTRTEDPV
ncbi:MAG: glycosyltransferase family 1 protein [Armatimonadia bacterium]